MRDDLCKAVKMLGMQGQEAVTIERQRKPLHNIAAKAVEGSAH